MINLKILPLSGSGFVAHQKTIVEVSCGSDVKIYESKRDWNSAIAHLNELLKGDNFLEVFQCDDVNIWQFFHSYIVADFLYLIDLNEIFHSIIDDYSSSEKILIKIPNDRYYHPTIDLCGLFFKNYELKAQQKKVKDSIKEALNFFQIIIFLRFCVFIVKKLLVKIPNILLRNKLKTKNVLFVSHDTYSVKNEKGLYFDRILDPYIKDAISKGYRAIGIDCPYNGNLQSILRFLHRVFKDKNKVNWLSFSAFDTFFKRERNRNFGQKFVQLKNQFLGSSKIEFIVLSIIKNLHPNLYYDIVDYLAQAEAIINKLRPKAIVAAYETGPFARALILMANKNNIPTFGVQHGMLLANHSDYMHSQLASRYNTKEFMIPDKTFVWGKFWKDILCRNGNYPEDSVVVSGNFWISNHSSDGKTSNQDYVLILYVGITKEDDLKTIITYSKEIFKNKKIYIKTHPCLAGQSFHEEFMDVHYISDTPDFYSLIYNAHCCISDISTAALEMFAIHPIGGFVLNVNKLPGWEFLEQFGNCYIDSLDHLKNVLFQYENSLLFRQQIKQQCKSKVLDYFSENNFEKSINIIYSTVIA